MYNHSVYKIYNTSLTVVDPWLFNTLYFTPACELPHWESLEGKDGSCTTAKTVEEMYNQC